ncbi:MAG: hypothetical protein HZA53_15970 [Planctomycetes bacterium]|nr:hypothetical protein [Planctomycetota bacterium]
MGNLPSQGEPDLLHARAAGLDVQLAGREALEDAPRCAAREQGARVRHADVVGEGCEEAFEFCTRSNSGGFLEGTRVRAQEREALFGRRSPGTERVLADEVRERDGVVARERPTIVLLLAPEPPLFDDARSLEQRHHRGAQDRAQCRRDRESDARTHACPPERAPSKTIAASRRDHRPESVVRAGRVCASPVPRNAARAFLTSCVDAWGTPRAAPHDAVAAEYAHGPHADGALARDHER